MREKLGHKQRNRGCLTYQNSLLLIYFETLRNQKKEIIPRKALDVQASTLVESRKKSLNHESVRCFDADLVARSRLAFWNFVDLKVSLEGIRTLSMRNNIFSQNDRDKSL